MFLSPGKWLQLLGLFVAIAWLSIPCLYSEEAIATTYPQDDDWPTLQFFAPHLLSLPACFPCNEMATLLQHFPIEHGHPLSSQHLLRRRPIPLGQCVVCDMSLW